MSFFPYFVCALLGVDSLQGGLAEGNRFFFSPPSANSCQPPAATNRQLPTTANHHQPPITNRRQPPPTATNLQSPTANRQSPPTMVEDMSYTRLFCKTAVQEHFFFHLKDPPCSPPRSGPPEVFAHSWVSIFEQAAPLAWQVPEWPSAPHAAHYSARKANHCPPPPASPAPALAPSMTMPAGGAAPKGRRSHGGIMSRHPTSCTFGTAPLHPQLWVGSQPPHPRLENPLLGRQTSVHPEAASGKGTPPSCPPPPPTHTALSSVALPLQDHREPLQKKGPEKPKWRAGAVWPRTRLCFVGWGGSERVPSEEPCGWRWVLLSCP